MAIPFSRPLIDQDVIDEVNDALVNTGWLTSGPKVQALEAEIGKLTGTPVLAVNSWTSGAMLMLRWFGVGPGDQVIIPAYTYAATALCALNLGAEVVMVDVLDDFTIDPDLLAGAVTDRTKAIIPVDIGGLPAHYDRIMDVARTAATGFQPAGDRQRTLGRPLVVTDAAHSIGATYRGVQNGRQADVTVFSLHSVKNVTTGEGGAICLNLPEPFDNDAELKTLRALALNGQTKSAFEKNQTGAWRYDIVGQGLKVNLPDLGAAVGLAQLRKYPDQLLPDRKRMFRRYLDGFAGKPWAILPSMGDADRESSCHLFLLRVDGADETARDRIIDRISAAGVGVNVHYPPMASLTLFRQLGYRAEDYPVTLGLYRNEITLPLYNGLTDEQLDEVIRVVSAAVEAELASAGAASSGSEPAGAAE